MSENLLFLKGVAYFNETENAEELLLQLSYDIHDDNIFSNVWLKNESNNWLSEYLKKLQHRNFERVEFSDICVRGTHPFEFHVH